MGRIALPATASSPILLDTVLLIFIRIGYFLISRRFLLATLSPTLRDISKPETIETSTPAGSRLVSLNEDDDEGGLLPTTSNLVPSRNMSELEIDSEIDSSRPGSPAPSPPISAAHLNAESMELDSLRGAKKPKKVVVLNHGGKSEQSRTARQTARGLGSIARTLFSLCFAESCILLTLVMFHSVGILHSRSRHVHFSFSLHALLSLVLVIIPLVQCMFLTYRSRDSSTSLTTRRKGLNLTLSKRMLLSLLPFAIYIFLFTRIPPYVTTVTPSSVVGDSDSEARDTSRQEGWEGGGWLEPSLGRVVVLGVVVMGALSGLGAVRTAWMFLEGGGITGGRKLSDNDILQAERSLYRVRHDLDAKREEINAASKARADAPSSSNWMGRVFGGNGEAASLDAELRGLQAMESQVSRSVDAMKMRRQRQSFGDSWCGKGYNVVGYVFAAYCIARVLLCLTSLVSPLSTSQVAVDDSAGPQPKGNTNGDWISFLIALGLSQLPNNSVDVVMWARGISLLLTGLLILSSLAQVLRSVSRILRLTSKSVGIGFLLLSLSQLMSTYVISLLIQVRTSLPPTPVLPDGLFTGGTAGDADIPAPVYQEDPSLLATLPDFRIFGRLFDVVFLVAAATTLAYRYIAKRVNGAEEFGEIYQ